MSKEASSKRTNKYEKTEFLALLEEVRKQLLDASTIFDIWVQLWPTEQIITTINQYKGFFQPIRKVLFEQFSIKMCNVISTDTRLPSFQKIFKILDTQPDFTPTLNVRTLRKHLRQNNKIITAIEKYRNTKAAHWDLTPQKAEQPPILFGECKHLLVVLQNIYNEIYGDITKGEWSFEYVEHNEASNVLLHLSEAAEIHKKRIEELMSKLDEHR
jgi:hypothetical protein